MFEPYTYIVFSIILIIIFLSLGILTIRRNPRTAISWVFAFFCFGFANYYFTSLFLFPDVNYRADHIPFAMRWKWAYASLMPALFLHLLYFYFFPKTRTWMKWIIRGVYVTGFLFLSLTLLSEWIIAGIVFRTATTIVGPESGPLLLPYIIFLGFSILFGLAILVCTLIRSRSNLVRNQVLMVIAPILILTVAFLLNAFLILPNGSKTNVWHPIADLSFLVLGLLLSNAVYRYGAVTGMPVFFHEIVRAVLLLITVIGLLFLSSAADLALSRSIGFRFPLVSLIVLLATVYLFPLAWQQLGRLNRTVSKISPHAEEEHIKGTSPAYPINSETIKALLDTIRIQVEVPAAAMTVLMEAASLRIQVIAVSGQNHLEPEDTLKLPDRRFLRFAYLLNGPFFNQFPEFRKLDIGLIFPLPEDVIQPGRKAFILLSNRADGSLFNTGDLMKIHQILDECQRSQDLTAAETADKITEQADFSPDVDLSIQLFGHFQAWRRGTRIAESDWGGERSRLLLGYLIWKYPNGVTREELCEFLWPDAPYSKSVNSFHVNLHRLRKTLETELTHGKDSKYILYEGGRYRFNGNHSCWIDVVEFESMIRSGETGQLRKAVERYHGRFLQDLIWHFPPEAEIRQQMYENLYMQALTKLINLETGDRQLIYLQRLVSVEPTNQEVQVRLIQAHIRRGNLEKARESARNCLSVLKEYDLEPGQECLALCEKLEIN